MGQSIVFLFFGQKFFCQSPIFGIWWSAHGDCLPLICQSVDNNVTVTRWSTDSFKLSDNDPLALVGLWSTDSRMTSKFLCRCRPLVMCVFGMLSFFFFLIWVLRPFQEYFTYIKPIVNQRWGKTGVPGEKPPDLPVQNLASHMWPERGSNPQRWKI